MTCFSARIHTLLTTCFLFTPLVISAGDIPPSVYQQLYAGAYDSVLVTLHTLNQAQPDDEQVLILLAEAYTGSQRWNEALEYRERIYSTNPANRSNTLALASLLQKRGFPERAVDVLEMGHQQDEADTGFLQNLATITYSERQYDQASQWCDKLLEMEPDRSEIHLVAALSAAKSDRHAKAEQHFARAYELDALNATTTYEYARHLHTRAKHEEALGILGPDTTSIQGSFRRLLLIGSCYYDLRRYEEAATWLEAALKGRERSLELNKKLAFCYFALQQYQPAYDRFLTAETFDDHDPATYYYLGICARELGRDRAAAAYLNKSITMIAPSYLDDLYIALGQCQHDLKQYPEAIRSYRKALEISPDNGTTYYLLANVYYDYYADHNVALEHYRKALNYDLSQVLRDYIGEQTRYIQEQMFFME